MDLKRIEITIKEGKVKYASRVYNICFWIKEHGFYGFNIRFYIYELENKEDKDFILTDIDKNPIRVFSRMEDIVRYLSIRYGKDIPISIEGEPVKMVSKEDIKKIYT